VREGDAGYSPLRSQTGAVFQTQLSVGRGIQGTFLLLVTTCLVWTG
jgi:hypothetical protein